MCNDVRKSMKQYNLPSFDPDEMMLNCFECFRIFEFSKLIKQIFLPYTTKATTVKADGETAQVLLFIFIK